MSTKSRRKNFPVIKRLQDSPYNYQFLQAVRILERSAALAGDNADVQPKKPVARFIPPYSEVVRFHSNNSLSFPSSEIASITKIKNGTENQWNMKVNLMGLTGAMGVPIGKKA